MNKRALATILFAAAAPEFAAAQQFPFVGRVLADNGEAVAGAAVTARWCANPELPGLVGWTLGAADELGCRSMVVTTDASGRFRFELPVSGPVAIVARDAAASLQSRRCFPVMAGVATDVVLRPVDWLAGVVHDANGQPLSGCELVLDPHSSAWMNRTVRGLPCTRVRLATDASGRFRHALEHAWLATSMEEPFAMLVPSDPHLGFTSEVVVRPLPGSGALELQAAPRPLLRGVLRDLIGKVVADGTCCEKNAPWRGVRTDGNGAFAMPLGGSSELVVDAEGLTAGLVKWSEQGRILQNIEVKLLPSVRIVARLLDERGAPLADREVLWSTARREEPPFERSTRTDADGCVAFDDAPGLTTGSGFVLVDGVWRRSLRRRISGNEDLGDLTLCWRPLEGQVLDERGVPCAGARVVACEHDVIGPLPMCWVTYTNHGGRFRFASLPRSAFTVLVEAGTNGLAHTAVAADAVACEVRLVAGQSLEVSVTGDDNKPAAGAWVMLDGGDGALGSEAPAPTPWETSLVGIADGNGIVRFRGLPEREWGLSAFQLQAGVLTTALIDVPIPTDAVTVSLGAAR